MHRWVRTLLGVGSIVAALTGCEAPGVGDPCDPEQVPTGGFVDSESYLETSSVQCRTRVCMVYRLQGVPSFVAPDGTVVCGTDDIASCADPTETSNRVYCTCRCRAPSGATATLCECPDGFSCVDIVESESADIGVRGGYCVKSDTVDPEDLEM